MRKEMLKAESLLAALLGPLKAPEGNHPRAQEGPGGLAAGKDNSHHEEDSQPVHDVSEAQAVTSDPNPGAPEGKPHITEGPQGH